MTATKIKVAIVGVGKIARDQHIPWIEKSDRFELAATVSRHSGVDGVENFASLDDLLARRDDITALSLCMPPQARFEAASAAISANRHVFLEKPPGATVSEAQALAAMAARQGVTLFASWHSRYAAGVEAARDWLEDKCIRGVEIVWKEDVRRWHPGQDWIWEPGGVGVFDPGINALSILTEILPEPVHLSSADLDFPENRAAPIAARLRFTNGSGHAVSADFDWRQTGPQSWDITVRTNEGDLALSSGGAKLVIADRTQVDGENREYEGLYARFAGLIDRGESDVDLSPLIHVADAFMLGRRHVVEPFHD